MNYVRKVFISFLYLFIIIQDNIIFLQNALSHNYFKSNCFLFLVSRLHLKVVQSTISFNFIEEQQAWWILLLGKKKKALFVPQIIQIPAWPFMIDERMGYLSLLHTKWYRVYTVFWCTKEVALEMDPPWITEVDIYYLDT